MRERTRCFYKYISAIFLKEDKNVTIEWRTGLRRREVITGDVRPIEQGDVDLAVQLLRSSSLTELRDESFLGEELLLKLGLNGEILDEFPTALYPWCGHGIRSWQYPIQFARYLIYLSTKNITSYIEIGCRFGGTFIIVVEYLRRFSDLHLAVGLDIVNSEIMVDYAKRSVGVEYKIINSMTPEGRSFIGSHNWGLAFIDGDHSYEGCFSDYQAVKQNAKIIGLHDIASSVCPGVVRTWQEIRQIVPANRMFEWTDQYKEVVERTGKTFLGIGIVDFQDVR